MSRHISWTAALALALAAAPFAARGQDQGATDPQSCAPIWQAIGLPEDAGDEGAPVTTVCHLGYITGHNDSRKAPNWVIERLTPALIERKFKRTGSFRADPALTLNAKPHAVPEDYKNNGFDKGHNAPAADFSGNKDFLIDTFFLSNAVPQVGIGFNQSIWASFEAQVRGLIRGDRPVLYIITGSVWQQARPIKISNDVCGTEMTLPVVKPAAICPATANGHSNAQCEAGVSVPAAMFKIVYDPGMDNAFAVLMQNESHANKYNDAGDYIEAHRVGIATIEQLTGLRFFSALPARKQRQMRDNCVDVRQH